MNYISNKELLSLTGKTAIVTGGAAGIGLGVASRLAEAGAQIIIADHDLVEAKKAAETLTQKSWKAKAVGVDVSNEAEVVRMVDETLADFKAIDILVNNAGIYPNIPLMNMKLADFEKVIHVNLRGVFLCTKHVADQMIKAKKGGKIINVTSIDALHPSMIGLAHYDASKHGVWGFTKNVALELAQHNIWVNAIAPGGILTPGVQNLSGGSQSKEDMQKNIEAFLATIPMHRLGDPDEIGKAALFLASDMSSYMTGSQIVVDGGALLS